MALLLIPFLGIPALAAAAYRFDWMTRTATALVPVGLLLGFAGQSRPRLSPYGADQRARWHAFRRFLLHFSRLDAADIPAVIMWEHYLVYATALGVAKQVLKQMNAVLPKLPEEQRRSLQRGLLAHHASSTRLGGGTIHAMDQLTSTMTRSFTAAARTARSSSSSGSGRGGGFSAGGGGGGGGGGGRAG